MRLGRRKSGILSPLEVPPEERKFEPRQVPEFPSWFKARKQRDSEIALQGRMTRVDVLGLIGEDARDFRKVRRMKNRQKALARATRTERKAHGRQ